MDETGGGGINTLVTEAERLWKACAASLSEQVSDVTYMSSFEGIEPLSLADNRLVLAVPNTIVKDRLEGRYESLLADAIAAHAGPGISVELQVKIRERLDDSDEDDDDEVSESPENDPWITAVNRSPAVDDPDHSSLDTPINPRYTFESFVIGGSNHFAHAAALAVAETPARSYNPLFIHGEAGLGKTHLLHAIGHYVGQHFPGRSIRYVSTETFMNEFIDAIRTNTQPQFKRRYRECDVLLVDDVQFLENKEGTQEEFFHTFNTIYGAGGQIVITCDRHAKALVTLEDRLRTRFLQGLITDVQPPDLETRLAILRKKADWDGISLPDDVSEYVANNIKTNIRELEGALVRLSAFSSLNRAPVTLELAEQVLGDIISPEEPRQITAKLILSVTAETFGFTEEELMGASRRRPLVTARQISMYVFRELTDYSYPAVAREFGGRDHTTVIHAYEKIAGQMKERRQIYDQVTELINRIRKGL